jgi:hypothetical protein
MLPKKLTRHLNMGALFFEEAIWLYLQQHPQYLEDFFYNNYSIFNYFPNLPNSFWGLINSILTWQTIL